MKFTEAEAVVIAQALQDGAQRALDFALAQEELGLSNERKHNEAELLLEVSQFLLESTAGTAH